MRYLKCVRSIQLIPDSHYCYRVCYKKTTSKFISESSILSAHIMATELVKFAKRMGVCKEAEAHISHITAQKHWLGRLPDVFTIDKSVSLKQRKRMYVQLCGNSDYMRLCKIGTKYLSVSKITRFMIKIDKFILWYLFFAVYRLSRR